MTALQDWVRQDQIDAGEEVLPFVGSVDTQTSVGSIARAMRKVLEIESDWYKDRYKNRVLSKAEVAFPYLRERAEYAHIIVMQNGVAGRDTHRPLDPDEFRAFALIDTYAPLVFINRADESESARLFSLIHELVHVFLGEAELFNDSRIPSAVSVVEQVCNEVAGQILMPDEAFLQAWDRGTELSVQERIQEVQNYFPLSKLSIAVRALSFACITQEQYEQCQQLAQQWAHKQKLEKPKKSEGGSFTILSVAG